MMTVTVAVAIFAEKSDLSGGMAKCSGLATEMALDFLEYW
jgi:hypothetical protein